VQKTRETTILEILGKQNDQTFREIQNSSRIINNGKKMGTESCVLGLKELMKKELVKKDEKTKHYSIRTDTKNKTLLATRKHNIMSFDLDESMKELRENETPFEVGYVLLRGALYDLSKFTLERLSPGLQENERHEYDQLIKRCNDAIERTFSVLESIDPYQTEAIRVLLDNATTIPGYELGLEKIATNRQQRRAKKIAVRIVKKINSHV